MIPLVRGRLPGFRSDTLGASFRNGGAMGSGALARLCRWHGTARNLRGQMSVRVEPPGACCAGAGSPVINASRPKARRLPPSRMFRVSFHIASCLWRAP